MQGISIEELGGSCIIEKVHGKRAEDYDDYNHEYNPIKIEKYEH